MISTIKILINQLVAATNQELKVFIIEHTNGSMMIANRTCYVSTLFCKDGNNVMDSVFKFDSDSSHAAKK